MKTLIKLITAFIIAWMIATPARAADDPAYISLGAGATGVIADRAQGAAFNIEYRSDIDLWKIRPFVGGFATSDASLYGYFGFSVGHLFWAALGPDAEYRGRRLF